MSGIPMGAEIVMRNIHPVGKVSIQVQSAREQRKYTEGKTDNEANKIKIRPRHSTPAGYRLNCDDDAETRIIHFSTRAGLPPEDIIIDILLP